MVIILYLAGNVLCAKIEDSKTGPRTVFIEEYKTFSREGRSVIQITFYNTPNDQSQHIKTVYECNNPNFNFMQVIQNETPS